VPDSLALNQVEPLLRGRFGRPYLYMEQCRSTQDLLGPELPEGAVAVCEDQTAGRGRQGRSWTVPSRSSILCSLLLRPPPERRLPELSLVAGAAVAEAIEAATGVWVAIKWPNDLMVEGRKVGGILAEATEGVVVLGIGVNVNQSAEQLPPETRMPPGSLRVALGRELDRAPLLAALLDRLAAGYDHWLDSGLDVAALAARDFLRGRQVTAGETSGIASGIDELGRLQIEAGRTRIAVESGEISFEP
jgi:BirA family biotin operon repressor/biotin-[acetyl-CoA-carboxylase] ligase